jgi:hypothetical protein
VGLVADFLFWKKERFLINFRNILNLFAIFPLFFDIFIFLFLLNITRDGRRTDYRLEFGNNDYFKLFFFNFKHIFRVLGLKLIFII